MPESRSQERNKKDENRKNNRQANHRKETSVSNKKKVVQSGKKKKDKKFKRKIARYGMTITLVFFLAVLGTSWVTLSSKNIAEIEENSSSLPVASISMPVSKSELIVLGPYDEAEMPMLLNANNPLPEGYAPELIEVGYGNGKEQTMELRAGQAFIAMKEAAAAEGIILTPFSCYRSNAHQVSNYNSSIQNYIAQGYSEQQAIQMTQQYYAVPGTSEHEAGFAVDIDSIEESFENTPAFAWLQEHCTDYGFILRYEKDTEAITGIAYEPWHYRYVGANHAKAITEAGITLEEYVESNKKNTSMDTSSSSIGNTSSITSSSITSNSGINFTNSISSSAPTSGKSSAISNNVSSGAVSNGASKSYPNMG